MRGLSYSFSSSKRRTSAFALPTRKTLTLRSRASSFFFFLYSGFVEIKMESILIVFLSSFLLTVNSHPRNSDLIPKDYYKRQILQPIPGYIPVYIKTDGEPIIRSEIIKHDSKAQLTKVFDTEETKSSTKYAEPKSANTESDKMSTEPHLKKLKSELSNFSDTFQSKVISSNEKEKLTQTKNKKIEH